MKKNEMKKCFQLAADQAVKMPWHRLCTGVACSYSSVPRKKKLIKVRSVGVININAEE